MNSTERDLPEHASHDEDHKRIWLSPACDDERTWCQDDQGPCDECGAPSVEYVRADALASIRAERDAAVAAIRGVIAVADRNTVEFDRARAIIEGRQS